MRLLSYLFRDHGGKPLAERLRYLSIPKILSSLEIVAVRETISHSAPSSGSSFFSMVCFTFMALVSVLFLLIRSLIISRTALAAENLALRQQLALLNRKFTGRNSIGGIASSG
jgi:hypothetical protein